MLQELAVNLLVGSDTNTSISKRDDVDCTMNSVNPPPSVELGADGSPSTDVVAGQAHLRTEVQRLVSASRTLGQSAEANRVTALLLHVDSLLKAETAITQQ